MKTPEVTFSDIPGVQAYNVYEDKETDMDKESEKQVSTFSLFFSSLYIFFYKKK